MFGKRVFALIMAVMIVLSCLPGTVAAEEPTLSGTCGDGVIWVLEGSVLTISGTGPMTNYGSSFFAPWIANKVAYRIRSVRIEEGVTTVGSFAFFECPYLESVELPSTITEIGTLAFSRCTNLSDIVLPDKLTTIGNGAFAECHALSEIRIPEGVTVLENDVFKLCIGLTSVEFHDGIMGIGAYAFYQCSALENLDLPENLEYIGMNAFMNCVELKTLVLPKATEYVYSQAFYNCYMLKSIVMGNVKYLGDEAFSCCPELETITFTADAPEFTASCFNWVAATAYYPEGNVTWTEDVMQQYGGTLTWVSCEPVELKTQPQDTHAAEGQKATVTVKATGVGLTYEWYYKNPGASKFAKTDSFTGNTYTVTMTQARAGRQVYCVITDIFGNAVETDVVTLNLGNAATIVTQPTNAVVKEGEKAVVTVEAAGDGLTYQWYYKNATGSKFVLTTTFTSNTYSTTMNATRDRRQVYCVITDEYGNSVMTDTVTLYMGTAAAIVTQPEDALATEGARATVTVETEGDGLTYVWYYKNAGASKFTLTTTFTGNTYSTTMNATRDGRQVYCVITDKYGNSVTTNVVTLNMKHNAAIVTQPEDVTVPAGDRAKVTVEATGDGLTYEWYYKNAGSSKFAKTTSFTGNTYSTTMTAARDGRQVYCVITDQYGNSVTTDTVTLNME